MIAIITAKGAKGTATSLLKEIRRMPGGGGAFVQRQPRDDSWELVWDDGPPKWTTKGIRGWELHFQTNDKVLIEPESETTLNFSQA